MEQLFSSPQGREILIVIDQHNISFYHNDNLERQRVWVEQQREKGNEVSEEDENIDEFYWIPKIEWKDPIRKWSSHMKEKNWFTDGMEKFINNSLK